MKAYLIVGAAVLLAACGDNSGRTETQSPTTDQAGYATTAPTDPAAPDDLTAPPDQIAPEGTAATTTQGAGATTNTP